MMHPIHPVWGRGGSRIFLGVGALVSCSTSTPLSHIFFFSQNTSCIRKPQVISRGGGGGGGGRGWVGAKAQRLRWFVVATHRVYCVTSTLETFEHLIVCNLAVRLQTKHPGTEENKEVAEKNCSVLTYTANTSRMA